jgi:hypothetical protein
MLLVALCLGGAAVRIRLSCPEFQGTEMISCHHTISVVCVRRQHSRLRSISPALKEGVERSIGLPFFSMYNSATGGKRRDMGFHV